MFVSHDLAPVEAFNTTDLLEALEHSTPFPFADPTVTYPEQVPGFSDVFELHRPPTTDKPTLIALLGPSGSGKDGVLQGIEDQEEDLPYAIVRSATTRHRRPDEAPDAYVWMESDADLAEGMDGLATKYELVECQEHSGACYGIPLSSLQEAHDAHPDLPMLVKSDPGGVRMLRERAGDKVDIVCIGLTPQHYEQLWAHMEGRNARLQRIIDASRYAVEIRYLADFIVRNTEAENPADGIARTAEQMARLIRLIVRGD
jgi:guanylate kinase